MKTKVAFFRLTPISPRMFFLTSLIKESVYQIVVGGGQPHFTVNEIANELYSMGYTPRHDQGLAGEYLCDLLAIHKTQEFINLINDLKSVADLKDLNSKDDGMGLITFLAYY